MARCYKDKVVLITGASAGIGKALAHEFSKQGAKVFLAARRENRLVELSSRIQGSAYRKTDVNNAEELKAAVEACVQRFGQLDLFIANAGFAVVGAAEDLSLADYRRQFETNVMSVISSYQLSLPHLIKSQGQFCTIGSVMSHVSLPGASAYSMSKYAVKAFNDAIYHEVRSKGVGTTLICPGVIKSEIRKVDKEGQFDASRKETVPEWLIMDADVCAQKIRKALEREKKESVITLHGKLGAFIKRHFPCCLDMILRLSKYNRTRYQSTN